MVLFFLTYIFNLIFLNKLKKDCSVNFGDNRTFNSEYFGTDTF